MMPHVCLQFVIVAFLDHNHLLFLYMEAIIWVPVELATQSMEGMGAC